jgi:hypothetical protein
MEFHFFLRSGRRTADGINGLTAVFLTKSVSAMDDAGLKRFLTGQGVGLGESGTTIVRRDEHVFVNFGFEAK